MSNETNIRLSRAIRIALGTGLAASMAFGPVAYAEEETADLERVQVTGSRLNRLDLEGALPVTVIDRAQIDLSGQISVADLLRSTSFNSAGSFRPQSGSSFQSFAGVSLRGLGEGRTLILIDGRRAPISPNVGSAQDLNSIPLAAVERIEILSDGASAIYGSDAIGGVVNIITRQDFTGAEVTVGASNPAREGGDTAQFSALMGVSGDRGQVMFGVSRNHRDIIFQRERPWSTGGASGYSNNLHSADSYPNFYFNPTHGAALPGGCEGPGFAVSGSGDESLCIYDFTLQAADEAELENQSLFVRGNYEVNSNWTNYFSASIGRVQSFGRYAPVPSSPWPGGQPYLAPGTPNHPATIGGNNPFAEDYQELAGQGIWFSHRFAALGPRDDTVDANAYDVNLGFKGSIGRFDLDLGVRNTESKNIVIGRNYVVGSLAQQFIDGVDSDGDGTIDQIYNIYDPFSVTDDIANAMITTINRESVFKAQEVYASASTDLFDMPAGPVLAAFGGEYRDESYADIYDSLSEGGQVVGSAGNSAGGGRNVAAAFFETQFPLLDDVEMNIAGRYDRYSDYGSDFSPKISFRYQPTDVVTLRTSYGQGFRAPTLDVLTQKPAFGADGVKHAPTAISIGAPTPTTGIQVTSWSISNPDLESEQSDQFSFGIAFEPTNWISGSLDFSRIEITNQIASIDSQRLIDCLEGAPGNACPSGLSLLDPSQNPPIVANGLGVAFQNGPNTPVVYTQTGVTNLGKIETNFVDFNLRTNFNLGGGQLTNNLQLSHVNSWKLDGEELAGESELPDMRAKVENVYAFGDFSVAWNINFIGAQKTSERGLDFDEATDEPIPGTDPGVDSWLTHDIQFNWFTSWDGRLTLGAVNVTDKDPPLDEGQGRGFNFDLYDGYGRLPYLRYTQNF